MLPEIETAITPEEAAALLECVADRHVILEIGSAQGFSTVVMAEPKRVVSRIVMSVDPHTHYDSWEVFNDNIEKHSATGRVLPFRATNKQVLPYMGDNSVDMAFIDGDHSYEACLYDLLNCLRIVRPGGIIAIHDYCTPRMPEGGNDGNVSFDIGFPGVRRAVDEHMGNYRTHLVGTLFIAEV